MHKCGLPVYSAGLLRNDEQVIPVTTFEGKMGTVIAHEFNGHLVEKFTGEARWRGFCLVTYKTTKGSIRHLVEVMPQGFQMIAVTGQLQLIDSELFLGEPDGG